MNIYTTLFVGKFTIFNKTKQKKTYDVTFSHNISYEPEIYANKFVKKILQIIDWASKIVQKFIWELMIFIIVLKNKFVN